jgi:hypothetical protein
VSQDAALEEYGVVLGSDGESVDADATAARRKDRPPVDGLFHRGTYRDVLE